MIRLSRRAALTGLIAATASVSSACALPPVMATTDPGPLAGSSWIVTRIGTTTLPETGLVTMEFGPDGGLSGRAGCNQYTTTVTETGAEISVGTVAKTRVACAPKLAEIERNWLSTLTNLTSFLIEADFSAAIFTARDGTQVIARPQVEL